MSPSSFPLDTAQLVALYMQCIFYGIVLITVGYGLRVLLWSHEGHLKARAQISWIMVGATIAMFTIATMEMAFGLQHNLDAFIYYNGPGGANSKFQDISNWANVMRLADYVAQTFIGDSIMIYRCYVVYNRNWKVVVVPVLLWLAETACGWVIVYIEATMHTAATVDEARLLPFITSLLSLTLAMTTITTSMIAYRILKVNHGIISQNVVRIGGSRRLTRVVRILVESGLLYTASVVVLICTFLASNNAQYGVSDVIVQLIPISFTLILIRVDRGVAIDDSTVQETLTAIQWNSVKVPVSTDMPGVNTCHAIAVSNGTNSASHTEVYAMDDVSRRCSSSDERDAGQEVHSDSMV